ncbi:hypothetical protein TCSYLVIO_000244, partial [Trypanosoma cruzi]
LGLRGLVLLVFACTYMYMYIYKWHVRLLTQPTNDVSRNTPPTFSPPPFAKKKKKQQQQQQTLTHTRERKRENGIEREGESWQIYFRPEANTPGWTSGAAPQKQMCPATQLPPHTQTPRRPCTHGGLLFPQTVSFFRFIKKKPKHTQKKNKTKNTPLTSLYTSVKKEKKIIIFFFLRFSRRFPIFLLLYKYVYLYKSKSLLRRRSWRLKCLT